MSDSNVTQAYDAIAADYDRAVAGDAWMRRRVWDSYLRSFRAGQHILDLSCGTGIDAVFLAQHNIRVTGIDISPAMIERFRANARSAGVEEHVSAALLDLSDLTAFGDGAFDGAISAFAGLNTGSDLTALADQLPRVLRPRGVVVLHVLNRFSLWEWLGLVAGHRWSEARRLGSVDRRSFVIGDRPVQHILYDPTGTFTRFFAKNFRLRRAYGLGILRPPHTVARFPAPIVGALERLDRAIGGYDPFVRWGRFFVLELESRT
jgi:ubiquinone/menaquinone biosynthesis C-methylase UbiE